MNLHYRVEKAFNDLENAIACAELYNSTSAADAECYAQLLEDIIDLRDSAKKEAAPAVGATEAAKKNISDPIIDDILDDVKDRRFMIRKVKRTCTDLCIILHTDSESERDHITKYLFDIFEKIIEIYNLGKQDNRKEVDA